MQRVQELFKDARFPPFRILNQRSLSPDLVILQAAWQVPLDFQPPWVYTGLYQSITCSACRTANPAHQGTILAHQISARHVPGAEPSRRTTAHDDALTSFMLML
jgi:hypothetical protein